VGFEANGVEDQKVEFAELLQRFVGDAADVGDVAALRAGSRSVAGASKR